MHSATTFVAPLAGFRGTLFGSCCNNSKKIKYCELLDLKQLFAVSQHFPILLQLCSSTWCGFFVDLQAPQAMLYNVGHLI